VIVAIHEVLMDQRRPHRRVARAVRRLVRRGRPVRRAGRCCAYGCPCMGPAASPCLRAPSLDAPGARRRTGL